MLWSYDTRDTSRDQQLAGMQRVDDHARRKYADWASVSGQVPDPVLWSRMADNDQHATAKVTEGHSPPRSSRPWPTTRPRSPRRTSTPSPSPASSASPGRAAAAEPRSRAMTLAVQCRPNHDCALAAIVPTVAP